MTKLEARRPAIDWPLERTGLVVTAEGMLVTLLAVTAAALRLVGLAWLPLDEAEAAVALSARGGFGAAPAVEPVAAPLLFQIERLTMWLLGDGDRVARLAPALAGVAIVLLARKLRPWLGSTGVVAAAAVFALSPMWTYLGRNLSAATLSGATVLLLIGAVASAGARRWLAVAAAAGLALTGGGVTFQLVGALVIYAVIGLARGGRGWLEQAVSQLPADAPSRTAAGVAFGAAAVLASTGLLTRLDGLAMLVQSPSGWVAGLARAGVGYWDGFLMPLLVYAPVMVVFGLAGAAIAVREGERGGEFLAVWLITGLGVGLLTGSPVALAGFVLPLTLAAAVGLARLAEHLAAGFRWSEDGAMTGILLTVVAFSLIQAVTYADTGSESARYLMVGALVLAGLLVAVFAILWGGGLAARVLGLTTVVVFSVLAWANGSPLIYYAGRDLRELMQPRVVTTDAGQLADNLTGASWAQTRDPNALRAVADQSLRGVLAWPLRRRQDLTWSVADGTGSPGAVIAPRLAGESEPLPWPYQGQAYLIVADWRPRFSDGLRDFLRWYIQRRGPDGPSLTSDIAYEQAILYLRAE